MKLTGSLTKARWLQGTQGASLLALVLLPKCPMCLGAYLGFVTTLGISTLTVAKWLVVLLCLSGGSVLLKLYHNGKIHGRWLAFWLGFSGLTLVLTERFIWSSAWLQWGGLAIFLAGCFLEYFHYARNNRFCAIKAS